VRYLVLVHIQWATEPLPDAPLEKEYPGPLLKLRVTALLRCEQYAEALAVLKAAPGTLKDSLRLQEAYCLYRTGALSKGLELLNKNDGALSSQAVPAAHLKAQILYRLHRYSETLDVYSKMSSGEDSAELRTNCLAVMAASAASGSVLQDKEVTGKSVPEVYEEAYNLACLHMAKGAWSQAQSMLERAKGIPFI
jgi:signal recognition particle subunit SRP72